MQSVLLADLIDEKRLEKCFGSLKPEDQARAITLFNRCLYLSLLQMCLPLFPLEQYQKLAQELAALEGSGKMWVAQQRLEIRQLIPEVIGRFMLNLESHL